jgi:F0F1-type ATP synthase gamma subunit
MKFNTMGTLNPISLFKMYDYAGLGGINPDSKPRWYKRQVIRHALEKLRKCGFIKNEVVYSNDLVSIVKESLSRDKVLPESKRAKSKDQKKEVKSYSCPHGYDWGDVLYDHAECHLCKLRLECLFTPEQY